MNVNILKSLFFSLLFVGITSLLLKNFQLLGLTDNIFFLQPVYSFSDFTLSISILGGIENYLLAHFSPFLFLFAPIKYLEPVVAIFFLNFLAYFFIYFSFLYVWFENQFDLRKYLIFSIVLFFSSTIFFNNLLNFNGLQQVHFAPPFLVLSYYYAFIKRDGFRAILWFVPLFFIKEEFFVISFFYGISLFLMFKNKRYLLLSLFGLIATGIFMFIAKKYSYMGAGLTAGRYDWFFNAKSFIEIINNFLSLPHLGVKTVIISVFFASILPLLKLKKDRDLLALLIVASSTVLYCYLSSFAANSYFLTEHYGLVLVPLFLITIKKYGVISKKRLMVYSFVQLFIIIVILYFKQPWQYKFYQDEETLITKVIPKLSLSEENTVFVEDRTGIYLAKYNIDYISFFNEQSKAKNRYLIFNTRYSYSSRNLKFKQVKELSTYNYLQTFNFLGYKKIYENYPFIVLEKSNEEKPTFDKNILNEWDKKTIESNRWF